MKYQHRAATRDFKCIATASGLGRVLGVTMAMGTAGFALTVPPVAPQSILWKGIADTATTANSYFGSGGTLSLFTNIGPPILAQSTVDVYAFKAKIQNAVMTSGLVVTPANDEGIWGNGGPVSQATPMGLTPWLIAWEGQAVPTISPAPAGSWGQLGMTNSLTVRGLQVGSSGQTIATVNTNAPGSGEAYLFDNACLQTLAASGPAVPLPYRDLQTLVTDDVGVQLAGWAKNATPRSGTLEWLPTIGSLPCTLVPGGTISWQTLNSAPPGTGLYQPIPAHQGSPAISERGIVAHYAVDTAPAVNRPHIRVDRNTTSAIVVRRGWAAAGMFPRFGNFHSALMAVCDNPAPANFTVAWQMLDMRLTPAGAPMPNSNSLWAKCNVGPYHLIAYQNQVAPDLPAGDYFGSFHALHVTRFGTTGDSLVFFGTKIVGIHAGKTAIYVVPITAGGTVMGPYTMIATDVPSISPVNPLVSVPDTIGVLFPYFSTNSYGDVLMKATLAVATPATRQVLLTANSAAGHALCVRSQSGQPITPPACATGFITNFTIASPEQGCYSRGQSINSRQGITARINFTGGHGAFVGF